MIDAMSEQAVAFNVKRSAAGRVWRLRAVSDAQVLALTQQQDIPELLARILAARGVAPPQLASYLNPKLRDSLPDPAILKDCEKAAKRLADAVMNKEKIAIFGDYDVDGATSSAVLARYLMALGQPPHCYIPDRQKEGYGPNQAAFDALYDDGFKLVVTVDCGTMAHAVLAHAKKRGMQIIVADHHQTGGGLPDCFALINPRRADCTSDLGYLAAVGVSFLLVVALNRQLRKMDFFDAENPPPDLLALTDLVALGTVCDVVPLQGVNRAFVKQGLKMAEQTKNLGLTALKQVAHTANSNTRWDSYMLGFQLGPRINAGGRIGQPDLGVRLLTTESQEEASALALRLNEYNSERQQIEAAVLQEATQAVEDMVASRNAVPPYLLQAREGWHAGVVGIVAGRLKDTYHRPSFVIALDKNGMGKGSARSVSSVDIGRLVAQAMDKGLIEAGGGHAMAAGVTLHKDQLPDFEAYLTEELGGLALDAPHQLMLDASLLPSAASRDLFEMMQRAGPFGAGNPEPRVVLPSVRVAYAKIVGQGHVSCTLTDSNNGRLKAIAFTSVPDEVRGLLQRTKMPLHIAGFLRADDWNGKRGVQLVVHDAAELA